MICIDVGNIVFEDSETRSVTSKREARPDPPDDRVESMTNNIESFRNNTRRLGRTLLDPPTAGQPHVPLAAASGEEIVTSTSIASSVPEPVPPTETMDNAPGRPSEASVALRHLPQASGHEQDGDTKRKQHPATVTETSLVLPDSPPKSEVDTKRKRHPPGSASVSETSMVLYPKQVGSKRKQDLSRSSNKRLGFGSVKPIPIPVNEVNCSMEQGITHPPFHAAKIGKRRKKDSRDGEDPWKVSFCGPSFRDDGAMSWHEQSCVHVHGQDVNDTEDIDNHNMRMWAVCSEIEYEGLCRKQD